MVISSKLNAALKQRLQSSVPPGWNLAESQLCKGGHCACVFACSCRRYWVCKMPDDGSGVQPWTYQFARHVCWCSFIYWQSPPVVVCEILYPISNEEIQPSNSSASSLKDAWLKFQFLEEEVTWEKLSISNTMSKCSKKETHARTHARTRAHTLNQTGIDSKKKIK